MAHFLIVAKQTLLKKNIGKRLPWQYFTMKYYTLFIVWWRKRDLTAPWLKVLTVCELGTQGLLVPFTFCFADLKQVGSQRGQSVQLICCANRKVLKKEVENENVRHLVPQVALFTAKHKDCNLAGVPAIPVGCVCSYNGWVCSTWSHSCSKLNEEGDFLQNGPHLLTVLLHT